MADPDGMRRAVIIEDDDDIRGLLETVLTHAGFEAHTANSGSAGIAAVAAFSPTIVTLDVNMPGMDGFAAARQIREISDAYILMLTGLGEEIDVIEGFKSGADDYVTKPFRPRELRARIEALLRRPRIGSEDTASTTSTSPNAPAAPAPVPPSAVPPPVPPATPQQPPSPAVAAPVYEVAQTVESEGAPELDDWISFKGIKLSPGSRIVWLQNYEVVLTRSEFDLLHSLMTTGRRVRSKADLALMLRGESYVTSYLVSEADKRAVEVHISNLRRKLGDTGPNAKWIETVRGIGYRMAAESS